MLDHELVFEDCWPTSSSDLGYDAGETFGRHFVERITKTRPGWYLAVPLGRFRLVRAASRIVFSL